MSYAPTIRFSHLPQILTTDIHYSLSETSGDVNLTTSCIVENLGLSITSAAAEALQVDLALLTLEVQSSGAAGGSLSLTWDTTQTSLQVSNRLAAALASVVQSLDPSRDLQRLRSPSREVSSAASCRFVLSKAAGQFLLTRAVAVSCGETIALFI